MVQDSSSCKQNEHNEGREEKKNVKNENNMMKENDSTNF